MDRSIGHYEWSQSALPARARVRFKLFVCLFTDSGSCDGIVLLRIEPALPEGSRSSRAGRRDPFRALDTDPSLGRAPGKFALQGSESRGPQNGGLVTIMCPC